MEGNSSFSYFFHNLAVHTSIVSSIIVVSDFDSISIEYPKKVSLQFIFSGGIPSCNRSRVSLSSRLQLKLTLDLEGAIWRFDIFLKSSNSLKVLHISLTDE